MKAHTLIVAALMVTLTGAITLAADKDKKDPLAGIKCPVTGKPVKAASAVDYKGAKVYFCCDNCPKAFAANTSKFAAKANHQLVGTSQAKLVKCPLLGKKLNPATKISIAGVNVCFCCNGCKGKAVKAKGDEQITLVFNDKAFAKGFKVSKPKKE